MSGNRIDTYPVTGSFARAHRALGKFGMNLADFAALTTSSRFDGFGNGTGYTVSNWISDGVFANLAAVQAVYPICQSGADTVDWVLLQSAIDFVIYGSLGNTNRKSTKCKLFLPAGNFVCNRTLNIGYGRIGTPPANLNGNGYVTIAIEGEGRQAYVGSANGMTGTSIDSTDIAGVGIAVSGYQNVKLKGFTLRGPFSRMVTNNTLYDANAWDRQTLKGSTPDVNWIGGNAVNVGIAMDPYTSLESAAAYPARILPASFGGGTSAVGYGGGTTVEVEDVRVEQFVIGMGRPYGDGNGEFYRIKDVDIYLCVHGLVCGHSQNRNVGISNVNFELCHTAISNIGGTRLNANLHGEYSNIHVGRCFQIIEHINADWSGPVTFRDIYAESFFRIGTFSNLLTFDGGYLSFLDQEAIHGSVHNHFKGGRLYLDRTQLRARDGIYIEAEDTNHVLLSNISYAGGTGVVTDADAGWGTEYFNKFLTIMGPNNRQVVGVVNSKTPYGQNGRSFSPDNNKTTISQEWMDYSGPYPTGGSWEASSGASTGAQHRFPVPKIGVYQASVTVSSRSGLDLTCPRYSLGDCKADKGDIFAAKPTTGTAATQDWNWFVVHAISGSNMVLRQLNNFDGASAYDYQVNGREQITTTTYLMHYVCTRIRNNHGFIVGDVTNGSNVITNVKLAFSGSGSGLTTDLLTMVAGDYFLHQEIERANTSGSILKNLNLVTNVNIAARTITLTDNFNITRTNYPIVFYVKVFNA